MSMFSNLVSFEPSVEISPGGSFTPVEKTTPVQMLDGQVGSSEWLDSLGVPSDEAVQAHAATKAFASLTTPNSSEDQKRALATLQVPQAVKHLVGMLTAYDWAFVEQAKEIRGYAVSKIMEETNHPDAKIRLRALELLGKVTEVALFTERSDIKQVGMLDTELDAELKRRLDQYARAEREVLELEQVEIDEEEERNAKKARDGEEALENDLAKTTE